MSNSLPLVSIALCTYNGAAFLSAQLYTLVNQTYPHIEIIAVDDQSADDTLAILNQYAVQYPNIKVYSNTQNLGYIKNYEKAFLLSTGELIAPADQDDIWELDKIALLANAIGNNLLIYHDSAFINQEGIPLNRKLSDVRNFYRGADSRVFLFDNCVSGHAMLFRRELLNYYIGFNKTIMHDWWLAYTALNHGTINYLPQALVQYRQHHNATTNILRIDRGEGKQKSRSLQKIEHQLAVIQHFTAYPHNKDEAFKLKLLQLMQNRMESYFSFSLALFVYRHRDVLLYIKKKPNHSKLNFIIKLAWGYKLKKLFN